jgi:5-enolpyruvylshikimate-3-phosphate synthase
MAMAVAGLAAQEGISIDGAEAADVSFPGFYARLRSLLGG